MSRPLASRVRARTLNARLAQARRRLELLEIEAADLDTTMPNPERGVEDCPTCAPHACDDPDRHLGVPTCYTPLANRGCRCGADFDGRDCMCFEDLY